MKGTGEKATEALKTCGYFLLILGLAVLLTFVEDWLEKMHRPEWLILGCKGLSIFMFMADGIVVVRLVTTILWREMQKIGKIFKR